MVSHTEVNKRRFRWLCLTITFAVIFAACAGPQGKDDDEDSPKKQATATNSATDSFVHLTPEQVRLADVQVSVAQERDIPITIKVTGRVTPRAQSEVEGTSPFPGRVVKVSPSLRMGNIVKQGEMLVVVEQLLTATENVDLLVNRTQLQATIDQTEREVAHHRQEYERAQQLQQVGAASLKELQQIELELNLAQSRHDAAIKAQAEYDAALAQNQSTPRRTNLTAPMTGTIVTTDVTTGQHIEPTQTLFTIVDLSTVWIEAQVFETDLAVVQRARTAHVIARAYPDDVFPVQIVTIGNTVDATARTVAVIFAAPNPQHRLKIGMSVEVRIPTDGQTRALVVPATAVLEGEHPLVYVEKEPGVFEARQVTIADRQDDVVLIAQGLRAGDHVVTIGAQQVHNEAMKAHIPIEEEGR